MRHSRTGKGPEQQGRGRDRACGVLCLCPPFRPELSLQAAAAGLVRTACAQSSQGLPTGAKSHARMAEPQPCPGARKGRGVATGWNGCRELALPGYWQDLGPASKQNGAPDLAPL